MKTLSRILVAATLSGAALAPVRAVEPDLSRDGWVSWQVAAPEGTPFWCCWSDWNDRLALNSTCKLENANHGYGSRDKSTTDSVRIYARSAGGKLERLQVLAAACPVETDTPIQELTGVTPDDSVRWLAARIRQAGDRVAAPESMNGQAVAALAMHRGDLASKELAGFARNDAREEVRKWSVFWLGLMRGAEGADIVSSVMFSDPLPEVRKHAAFAISQSKSPRVAPDLIELGNTDQDGDVRAQAWFWLAQTGYADAETPIMAALRKDTDRHVREQAVFSLTLLPGERATRALIATAEDRSLSREQRKRAVFWLSQSEADGAQAYLEKVLAVSAAR